MSSDKLLGSWVEQTLAAMKVTPENYRHAKAVLWLLPKCNCDGRKRMLNEIHAYAKIHGWASALVHAKQIPDKTIV